MELQRRAADSSVIRNSGTGINRYFGVYPVLVVDNNDPDGQGRVKVGLPRAQGSGENMEVWARLATMMAGNNRGTWFVPDIDDEVLVAFEGGDMRMPYVIGSLWNGSDTPPESISRGNNKKVLRSRNGIQIIMDDTDGEETLRLETPGGQKFVLQDGQGAIKITDSNGNKVTFASGGITVDGAAQVKVNASSVEITAGQLTVNAGLSKFSGTIKADKVVTNSVDSASYSPGAGNVW